MISLAHHTPLHMVNSQLRHHRLRIERAGALITVHDEAMPGISFGLPSNTMGHRLAALAVEGAAKRRAFIHGSSSERKAA